MELSKRLRTVADMVERGSGAADIGCDHGFVSIDIAEKYKDEPVFAMDVRPGPLSRAREHIKKAGLSNQITCVLSDGLQGLYAGQVDTVVIAGMGGILMKSILEGAPEVVEKLKQLVLSPQRDIPLVREYIAGAGFFIEKEEMLFDEGKYYVVMSCKPVDTPVTYSEMELKYGPVLLKNRTHEWLMYLRHKREKELEVLDILKRSGSGDISASRMLDLEESLKELDELLGD